MLGSEMVTDKLLEKNPAFFDLGIGIPYVMNLLTGRSSLINGYLSSDQ